MFGTIIVILLIGFVLFFAIKYKGKNRKEVEKTVYENEPEKFSRKEKEDYHYEDKK